MNVSSLADRIWKAEYGTDTNVFIGQSQNSYDGSPTVKKASSFSNIRGLAPEEPTKQGSYYAASVSLFGQENDINPVKGEQNIDTLAVALASPLPRIEIPINGKVVTVVPFAKSVGGSSGGASISSQAGQFQPTNQIVDFYVETIANTGPGNVDESINSGRPYGKFRINYEDVEQAADHDMDAIVEYEFIVNANNQLVINLNSTYAAGGIKQHMGYVISGTTADGTYLEVRDVDTVSDPDYFLDTPPGIPPATVSAWNDYKVLPLNASRTFTVGNSTSASFIKHDPLWYAAKWASTERKDDPNTSQNEDDGNTTLDKEEWDSDNDGSPDGYFLVTNAGKLDTQLNKAFNEIVARTTSASAVSTNSTRLDANSKIYQAVFNSKDWTGDILAFDLNDTNGQVNTMEWKASEHIPNSRNIYSYNPQAADTKGIEFEYVSLNDTQKSLMDHDYLGSKDDLGDKRVDYIRGDQTDEGALFRVRTSVLGDIVNSDPAFVGTSEDFGYSGLAGNEGEEYLAFRTKKLDRIPMLYFGANDGMLHGINADTGEEVFSYVPDSVISSLNKLTEPSYGCYGSGCISHTYFIDGPSRVADAYFDSEWHTTLVGSLGAGGKAIFAIDVTNPDQNNSIGSASSNIPAFSASNILWEVSTTQSPKADDLTHLQNYLGYSIGQASIVRMHNGKWAAILGNGYESTSNKAALVIIDIETGELLTPPIDTGVGSGSVPNGLATPIVIDVDNDRIVDYIYAGDLQGNLWKFDVTSSNPGFWDVAYKTGSIKQPLFIAKDASDKVQPITAKPQVRMHPDGGVMIFFGTGKYFEVNDDVVGSSPQIQTFYGIRDTGTKVGSRAELQQQSILFEETLASEAVDLRVVSDNTVDYKSKRGWYLDLIPPNNNAQGERVVSTPLLRNGRVIFTTLIPEQDPCGWGGSSWLMELDAISGARLATAPFDVNNDGKFDINDYVSYIDKNGDENKTPPSGIRQHNLGIVKTPGVVSVDNDKEIKFMSGSSGELGLIIESATDQTGRQSWRQIQ